MIKNYQIDTDPENYEAAGTLCSKRMYALGECDECGYLTFKKTKTECPHCEGLGVVLGKIGLEAPKSKNPKTQNQKETQRRNGAHQIYQIKDKQSNLIKSS
jgi:uncharacterized Zn finger protein (UPF0148 family)